MLGKQFVPQFKNVDLVFSKELSLLFLTTRCSYIRHSHPPAHIISKMQSTIQKQLARNLDRSQILKRSFHSTPIRNNSPFSYASFSRRESNAQPQKLSKGAPESLSNSQPPSRFDDALPMQRPHTDNLAKQTSTLFDLSNRVYITTGGARGLGLAMAESLAEAGGEVYCFDRNKQPDEEFAVANEQLRREPGTGTLHYRRVDISKVDEVNAAVASIADEKQRLDGLIAAAGILQVCPSIEYKVQDVRRMLDTNFIGVQETANACARQMFKYRSRGSMCLVASMSGLIANKGMLSPVYNATKAAVIQLAKNLSMEWSKVQSSGEGGIRVNALSPGHAITPMVKKELEATPGLQEEWEAENMMGRLADPSEFKGAALFLLSNASSFMTGSNLIVDGGHTAW